MASNTTCGSSSLPNAVRVTQTADVQTYFLKVFNINHLIHLSATAQAEMLGSADQWNVAVIVDSTGSMATTDSNCGGLTEFQCALSGIQFMLKDINPCFRGYSSCTTASN